MDLTVLGNQIRSFTFFSGQGELMGHVWSGTASERTTAFQVRYLATFVSATTTYEYFIEGIDTSSKS